MRIRLDPWPAEYEAPVAIEEFDPVADVPVDATVETTEWHPVSGSGSLPVSGCCFVDGTRRVEARVIAEDAGEYVHGLYGSLAAGFVHAEEDVARFGSICIERYLILGLGRSRGSAITAGRARLEFTASSVPENSPAAVLAELQRLMRVAEGRLAEGLAAEQRIVFVDGLSFHVTARHSIVGVIKRIIQPYLPRHLFALVETLGPGERTPLFSIPDGNNQRYSCFMRLTAPRGVEHSLAGVIRVETGASAGLERARELANLAASRLPHYASAAMQDPRAPQNLLPVGALEREMRRRLGDPLLVRRAIEKEIHEQGDR